MWIHNGYFVVKELLWNVLIKDFWYTNLILENILKHFRLDKERALSYSEATININLDANRLDMLVMSLDPLLLYIWLSFLKTNELFKLFLVYSQRKIYNTFARSLNWFILNSRTKDDFLEILFYDRNKVHHKIACGLGGVFLSIHSSFFW